MNQTEKTVLFKVLESLTSSSEESETLPLQTAYFEDNPKEYLEKLKLRVDSLQKQNNFSIGDIVIWKEGLKNKRYPDYKQPCIVIKKISPPLVDDDVTINEVLDMQVGFITDDDEFLTFNYDSFRFKLEKT